MRSPVEEGKRPGALRRLLRRVTAFHTVTILVNRFGGRTVAASPLDIRRVTPANVEDARSMDTPGRVEEFRRFLERGDAGYYAYRNGVVVHRSWLVRGPGQARLWHSWGRLDLEPCDAYLHYCETAPAARGTGIYPQVIALAAETALASGVQRVLIWTDADNLPSLRGIRRAGFVPERRVRLDIRFGRARQIERPLDDRDG